MASTDTRREPGHAYHEDWNYSDAQRLRTYERKLWWVITHEGVPVQAWGYLDAYVDRPGDWWFPYCGFSARQSPAYFSMSEDREAAVAEARRRLAEKQRDPSIPSVADRCRFCRLMPKQPPHCGLSDPASGDYH